MSEDEVRGRNDMLEPPRPLSSAPAVKISREITHAVIMVSGIVAVTTALLVGKLETAIFAVLMSNVFGYVAGRSKPEGVVGEQTLLGILKR